MLTLLAAQPRPRSASAEAWALDNPSFVAALVSGGDERLALDPASGLNRYLCPPSPAPGMVCLSSCTASPISDRSFQAAARLYRRVAEPPVRMQALALEAEALRRRIVVAFGVEDLAEAAPCTSGTDAMRMAMTLLASERPGMPVTLVLPSPAETGSGVPVAMANAAASVTPVYMALRDAAGEPRPAEAVSLDFVTAARTAPGRSVVVLTHGTKTGLVAPLYAPCGADVIVDACQARLSVRSLRHYLARGWPVAVTGSKFFGGPAFSGALLIPSARWSRSASLSQGALNCSDVNIGMMLRWEAALGAMGAFAAGGPARALHVQECAASVSGRLAAREHLTQLGGLEQSSDGWAERPTIFTFAVRDPRDRRRRLSVQELRPIYGSLAQAGVLLGQPVDLGPFGGLRIAVGARDAGNPNFADGLDRALDVLEWTVRRIRPAGAVA